MNKEKIIANAGTIFSDLKEVSDNIYKGELRIDNKSAGVYFLDLHGNVKAADFKNLQEEVLAEEYYNQKNELQWNIYFLLITDSVVSKDKELIEKDEKYARKYVFTEAEFLDFFTLDKDSGEIQTDIVGDWKKKLDAVDLQEVYGKETYVESVSRFITDKTLKIKTVSTTTQLPDSLKINFVNKITIKPSFRTYPIIRQFEFGKVNLLKGVNGVGKTSTLEAIEMIVCGRTFRNPDKMEEEGCVQAIINNRTVESFAPSNKGKYRQRDFEWYNNSYTRDNNIQRSFNRFNFFDSDASNNFSQSNSETEINQALENLILGGDFKYLKDRVNGFYNQSCRSDFE
jgi:exonuclease SbcC